LGKKPRGTGKHRSGLASYLRDQPTARRHE
jgi:hypothetical protein